MYSEREVRKLLNDRYNELTNLERELAIQEKQLEKEEAKLGIKGHDECREYFKKCGLIKDDNTYVMHHKDHLLKYRNPERYNEWRLEDLRVLTASEHAILHSTLRRSGL